MAKINKNLTLYLLRKVGKINVLTDRKKPTEKKELAVKTFETKVITKYGVKFSDKLFDALLHSSYEDMKDAFRKIESAIMSWKGTVEGVYPLFVDFPDKVPDTEDAFARTILNYLFKIEFSDSVTLPCGCKIAAKDIKRFGGCPSCGKMFENKDIKGLFSKKQLKAQKVKESDFFLGLQTIDLITDKEVKELFKDILSQSVPPSKSDMEFLQIVCEEEDDDELVRYIPSNITIKDTIIELITILMKTYSRNVANRLISATKLTAKDTLKLIRSFSGANDKIKLKSGERKLVLKIINRINPQIFAKEAYADRELWKKIAYMLHIKAANILVKYPDACEALLELCFDKNVRSFESELEKAFNEKNFNKTINLLKKKPGVMIRNIVRLAKISIENEDKLFSILPSICENIKTSLLLQISALLRARANKAGAYIPEKSAKNTESIESIDRAFLPKGSFSKMFVISEPTNKTSEKERAVMNKIADVVDNVLYARFAKKETFKELLANKSKIFISEKLKGALVPLSQKNAIEGFQALSRGSWMPLNEEIKILRLFCYWKAPTDIDLSALFIKESGKKDFRCFYGDKLPIGEGRVIHSGDVRSAPNGGHEFIDMNIAELLKREIRCVIATINSFSGEPFISQSCCVGILGINTLKDEILFDPKKVMFKQSLNGESKFNLPLFIDLKERKVFIVDINTAASARENIVTRERDIQRILKGTEGLNTISPNLYDLINLFAKANNLEAVREKELEAMEDDERSKVFSFDYEGDFSPYQTNDIIKIFLN